MSVSTQSRRTESVFGRIWNNQVLEFARPLVVLLLLWQVIAQFELVRRQALPLPYAVASTLWELVQTGEMADPAVATVIRAISALLLAAAIGIPLGLLMARFRAIGWFFDPLVSIGFPIPKITFVPMYLLWFGFGTTPTVLLAATAAVFPIIIATYQGARGVNREYIWSVRSMGVSKLATTWKVVLPASLPQIFNGLQIAVFLSFVLTLVTEMVTSGGGIGHQLILSVRFHRTPSALSFLFVAIAMGVVTDRIFRLFRARTLKWD